jgi:hypothetical protein
MRTRAEAMRAYSQEREDSLSRELAQMMDAYTDSVRPVRHVHSSLFSCVCV